MPECEFSDGIQPPINLVPNQRQKISTKSNETFCLKFNISKLGGKKFASCQRFFRDSPDLVTIILADKTQNRILDTLHIQLRGKISIQHLYFEPESNQKGGGEYLIKIFNECYIGLDFEFEFVLLCS